MALILFYCFAVALLLAGNFGLHWYLWRRLVVDPKLPTRLSKSIVSVLILFGVLAPINLAISRLFSRDTLAPFPAVVWTWMGLAIYTVMVLLAVDAVRLIRWLRARSTEPEVSSEPPASGEIDRRLFMSRALAGTAVMASSGITTYGIVRANGDFELPEVEVKLPRLPRALEGFRIALLSDIHIGPVLDGRFIDHIVEATNKTKPDLVCIAGDLVDGAVGVIGHEVARLQGLRSTYGTAFCTGNHEYYSGVVPWLEFLRGLGIQVLANERISVGDQGPGGASFDLAGIHDAFAQRRQPSMAADLAGALKGRDPDRELVLMAHQPSQIAMAEGQGVGLQLSGHTHGGQVWPFGVVTRMLQPYLKGHHTHHDGTQIYVSCGAGYWGPPIRVGAPPEVASIILTG